MRLYRPLKKVNSFLLLCRSLAWYYSWFLFICYSGIKLRFPAVGRMTIPKQNFHFLLFFPVLILLIAALDKNTALNAALQAFGGMIYIFLPMVMLVTMYTAGGFVLPLALILMLWMNDTMAYLVGSFIGKTPFSPISPKKTWEGTAGGAILTIAGAAIFGMYYTKFPMMHWIMLALCATVAGTAGDLLESKLKRLANIKDSGTMMPGHGGALDRFDSLLVATPFAFVYSYLFLFEYAV